MQGAGPLGVRPGEPSGLEEMPSWSREGSWSSKSTRVNREELRVRGIEPWRERSGGPGFTVSATASSPDSQ